MSLDKLVTLGVLILLALIADVLFFGAVMVDEPVIEILNQAAG